jgi:hypothetical protein
MNGADSGGRAQKVADLYLAPAFTDTTLPAPEDEDEIPRPSAAPAALTAAQIASYTGNYWSDELAIEYRIRSADGGLLLHIGDRAIKRLRPLRADTFLVQDELAEGDGYIVVAFKRTSRGKAGHLVVDAGPIHDVTFTRVR